VSGAELRESAIGETEFLREPLHWLLPHSIVELLDSEDCSCDARG
jgi:hypothetical protein